MSISLRRAALRAAGATALAGGLLLAAATPAFAHVTAQPGSAPKGGYSVISFRVPNESDTAGTIKLEVSFPADHPVTSARTTPQSGWTAEITKSPLATPIERNGSTITQAVTKVTWTAQPGTRIGPGQFVDFPLSVGPLPSDVDALVLPATQTYDDGTVVAWDQPSTGGAEPEHPAPTVTLTAAESGGHGQDAAAAGAEAGDTPSTDNTARWLAGAGLLLGALGLGLGGGAALRGRRDKSRSSS